MDRAQVEIDASLEIAEQPGSRHARRVIAGAAALGVLAQGLFWRTGIGANWLLLVVTLVTTSLLLFARRPLRAPAYVTASAAVILGVITVARASVFSAVIAVPLSACLVAVLPALLRTGAGFGELGQLPLELLRSLRAAPDAIRSTAELPSEALAGEGRSGALGLLRGLLFGLPITAIFAVLLSSDPKFAALAGHGAAEAGEWVLFAAASLVTAVLLALTYVLERSARATAAADGAPVRGPLPYRVPALSGEATRATSRLTPITWGLVIAQVALVFGVFAIANASDLFGGHDIVRSDDGPTYASHLHAGFAQLLIASGLSICLVLAGHHLLRPRDGLRTPRGGLALGLLECALLILSGITLASCWQRLAVYEDAYGATHLRLGVAFIQVAVLVALTLTAVKSMVRRWSGYAGAALTAAVVLGMLGAALNADGYIAEANLDRAARGKPLDVGYLATLSPDARGALEHPLVVAKPRLRSRLVTGFGHYYAERDARSFRGGVARILLADELARAAAE